VKTGIPDRSDLAGHDGTYVRRESNWRSELSGECLDRFMQINGETLARFGYTD